MKLPVYLGMLQRAEQELASSFRTVADGHGDEPDVRTTCELLASQCDEHVAAMQPLVDRYGAEPSDEPERLHAAALPHPRSGPLALLRDLQDVHLLASFVDMTWTLVGQAAAALRDEELQQVIADREAETQVQVGWLTTRMKQAAPQALVVAR
ncbi:MAG TPA: hypothetical protein VGC94_03240 [Amnibacterium sp.]|jgi:hypothetical protein